MPPTLVNSYKVEANANDMSSLVSPSFTPSVGELIVVKAANSDADQTLGTPSASGFTCGTWSQWVNVGTSGSGCRAAIWTAQVTAGGVAGTITVTASLGNRYHSMVVMRWQAGTWQLAGSPATVGVAVDATAPWQEDITTAQAGSVVTYVAADWNGVNPAGVAFSGDTATPSQEQVATYASGQYTAYWLTQDAASAGANTIGLSAPTGMSLTTAGLEIQGTGGSPTNVNAGSAAATAVAYDATILAGTAQLFAGAVSGISGSWVNTAGAVGSTQGDYATWTDSGSGSSATLEGLTFGADAAVPGGATVNDVKISIRHGDAPASQVASIVAQAYIGSTPVGSPQALTVADAVHEDTITVTGIARADLANLRVRITGIRIT